MDKSSTVVVSAEIDAPIWRVYQNWTRLERFPAFVRSVKEARWLTKGRLYWREEHDGASYESMFEVCMDVDNNGLSWKSLSGPSHRGSAHCEPQTDGRSRVTLTIQFTPDAESLTLAAVRSRHQAYLRAFKRFVETRTAKGSGESASPLANQAP